VIDIFDHDHEEKKFLIKHPAEQWRSQRWQLPNAEKS
jgi:hypothetical protein